MVVRRGIVPSVALGLTLSVLSAACDLPLVGSAQHERTVLVDYHHDQFNAVFAAYFPRTITVRAGDTLAFKAAFTGEPHTITLGTLVDKPFRDVGWSFLKNGPPFGQPPNTPEFQAAQQELNQFEPQTSSISDIPQNAAQPCYLDHGLPPQDLTKACAKRPQPAFTGRQSFYSSGFIGYQDTTYRVPIAADASPGIYYYTCLYHGPLMTAQLVIKPKNASIPSQDEVTRQAQNDLQKYVNPLARAYQQAKAGRLPDGTQVQGEFAGTGDSNVPGAVGEFVPRTIRARVSQKLTWHIVGDAHTISFDVPRYIPIFVTAKDGTVSQNPQTFQPVGGPGFPQTSPGGGNGPPAPVVVDAGGYDGSHFISSGIGGGQAGQDFAYSLTFTKAGTYKYACLVHPQMVGEVDVSQ
jgi:plastocyanin